MVPVASAGAVGEPLAGPAQGWPLDGLHGSERDARVGLVHRGTRHYREVDGLWLQPEPLLVLGVPDGSLGTPRLLMGTYAAGNVNVWHDADGYFALALAPPAAAGAIVVGAAVIGGASAVGATLYYGEQVRTSETAAAVRAASREAAGSVVDGVVNAVSSALSKADPAADAIEGGNAEAGGAPKVHEGKQGKHIEGHNNYSPGRSKLTADPGKLAESAGAGAQVGDTPVGEAGSKERVDFGEVIGEYIDGQTGQASETTKGVIHYDGDGKIHIVPARP